MRRPRGPGESGGSGERRESAGERETSEREEGKAEEYSGEGS